MLILFFLCKQIFWSENGELVCIATEDSFFILKFKAEAVEKAKEDKEKVTEDGIEDAFEARMFFGGSLFSSSFL